MQPKYPERARESFASDANAKSFCPYDKVSFSRSLFDRPNPTDTGIGSVFFSRSVKSLGQRKIV